MLLYNTMYLRCAIFLSTLKIVVLCHIDKRVEENLARRGENNPVMNENFTLTSNENSRSEYKIETFDETNPQKLALRQLDIPKNEWVNREELTEKGRFLKRRQVVTCDGFILTIFRLMGDEQPTKIPVLMMHGLYQSSDVFAKQIKDKSLAFKLQDLGYDVWLGNLRGNKYSRHHVYLDPEEQKQEFFNNTYEEMGIYDLAATVDFILNDTDYSQLHYISHSLGGTVFLVLNSLEPWHNGKFEGAHLMAPFGYQEFAYRNRLLSDEARKGDDTYKSLVKLGIVEIFPYTNESTVFLPDECLGNLTVNTKFICQQLKIKEKLDLKTQNNGIAETRGGSIKQLAHLAQNAKLRLFTRWNYGQRENENRYGTKIPPEYILSRVTVPTEIIFALNDDYVSAEDCIDMARDLANGTARAAGRRNFTHEDFLTAPDVFKAVYDEIIKDMEMNSNQRTQEETILHFDSSSTFCKRYFWPILIILIIIILILLGFLISLWRKEKEEKESGVCLPPSNHKSTQTVASVPAAPITVASLPAAPLPVAPPPVAHLPVAPLPAAPLPAAPLTAAPLPKAPLPTAPLPTAPLPKSPLPKARLPKSPLPKTRLPAAPLPAAPLPVVERVPACQFEYGRHFR